jgi:hypothetical protein
MDYPLNSNYPELSDTLYWMGPVDTQNMSVRLEANGEENGPWCGAVDRIGGVSNDATKSTFIYRYNVLLTDTDVEGAYSFVAVVTHSNGKVERIPLRGTINVVKCPG